MENREMCVDYNIINEIHTKQYSLYEIEFDITNPINHENIKDISDIQFIINDPALNRLFCVDNWDDGISLIEQRTVPCVEYHYAGIPWEEAMSVFGRILMNKNRFKCPVCITEMQVNYKLEIIDKELISDEIMFQCPKCGKEAIIYG